MMYHVIITKERNRVSVGDFPSREKAEKKIAKNYLDKKYEAEIIGIPTPMPGLKLYRHDSYANTIIRETKSLYILNNTINPMEIPDCILKENFNKFFIQKFYNGDIEEYDEDFVGSYRIDEELNQEQEEIIEEIAEDIEDAEIKYFG